MENIHVVLDSTANVPEQWLRRHENLHKVSLKLMLGAQEWEEDALTATQLFEEVRRARLFPTTSQPPLGAFIRVFEKIAAAGGQSLVLTMSGALSGTVQAAQAAARAVDEKNIRVVDSRTAALGTANMARQALAMIAAGASLDETAAAARRIAAATRTLILTDSLEYLHRGGRIGGAAALFGTVLQIKPILCLEEGKVAVFDKVRTRRRAIERMLAAVGAAGAPEFVGVAHSGAAAEADAVAQRLKELYPAARLAVGEVGAALAAHVGPAALGLMYQENAALSASAEQGGDGSEGNGDGQRDDYGQ